MKTTVKEEYNHEVLNSVGDDRLILLTAHRRENLGEPMRNMFRAIKRIVEEHEDVQVVYPVHMNPAVREVADEILGNDPRIQLIEPLDVIDFHNFAVESTFNFNGFWWSARRSSFSRSSRSCLRDTTERPEGIEAGTLKLAGTEEETIYSMAKELLTDQTEYEKMSKAANPYGDGEASRRICEAIRYYFKRTEEKPDVYQ